MRHLRIPVLLVLVLGATLTAGAQDRPTPLLQDLVPEHTFLLASVPNMASVGDQCKRTALSALWREEEVQQFVEPVLQFLSSQSQEMEKALGRPLSWLIDSLRGQMALAVVHFDPLYGGMVPDAVLYADFAEAAGEFRTFLDDVLGKNSEELGIKEAVHGDTAYRTMVAPPGIEISMAWLGSALVLTSRPERMTAVIDAYRSGQPTSLSANPAYRRVGELTGGAGRMLDVFLNVESIYGHFAGKMEPEARRALEATGLTGIKAIGWGSSFVGEGVRDSICVYAPGPKKGLLALLAGENPDRTRLLARIPRDAFYATSGGSDLAAIYGVIMETLGIIDPSLLDQAAGYVQQIEEFLGLRLVDDLLKPFGDEMAFYVSMPEHGGLVPDIVVLTRPRDPARLMASLEQIVAKFGSMMEDRPQYTLSHRRLEFMGRTIHYVHVAQSWGDPFPVTPCFVMDGDLMAVALYPQVLKDFLARGIDAPSVLTRPDFQRVLRGLPEGLASVEYFDFQAAARLLYGSLVPLAQMFVKEEGLPVDMAHLPRTETVVKHLFGFGSGAKFETDAGVLHCYSPTGILPMMVAGAAAGYFVAMQAAPMPVRIRDVPGEEPYRPVEPPMRVPEESSPVKARLDEIHVALLFYSTARYEYPEDLGDLVARQALPSADLLLIPGDEAPLTLPSGLRTSFEYTGKEAGNIQDGDESIVWVYEREGLSTGERWVLFANGAVRQVEEAEFERLLTATKERLAKDE